MRNGQARLERHLRTRARPQLTSTSQRAYRNEIPRVQKASGPPISNNVVNKRWWISCVEGMFGRCLAELQRDGDPIRG